MRILATALWLAAFAVSAARAGVDPCDKHRYVFHGPCSVRAVDAAIGRARALALDDRGNLYISSTSIVFRMDRNGLLERVAGDGTNGFAGDGGPATQALLNFPEVYPELAADPVDFSELMGGIAVDGDGNLYIADAYNDRVRKVDPGGTISTAAWSDGEWWPQGIALDSGGSMFVSGGWGTINRIAPDGRFATIGQLRWTPAEGLVLASDGAILVADAQCTIWRIGADLSLAVAAGGICGSVTTLNGSTLVGPYGVALDSAGDLLIADTWNNCIRRVDRTRLMVTIAGACGYRENGFSGDGGPARAARLDHPFGIAVDALGNIYVADSGNNRVRRIDVDGLISTVAGNGHPLRRP